MPITLALPTLPELRADVHDVLCRHEQLDPEQTPLAQAVITRRDRPCGLFFQARGPRQVKIYAVWAGDEDRVLFYDSTGGRFAETRLSDSPDPVLLAEPQRRAA